MVRARSAQGRLASTLNAAYGAGLLSESAVKRCDLRSGDVLAVGGQWIGLD